MVDSLSNNVVARPGWQYCLGGDYDGLIVAGVGDFVIGIDRGTFNYAYNIRYHGRVPRGPLNKNY